MRDARIDQQIEMQGAIQVKAGFKTADSSLNMEASELLLFQETMRKNPEDVNKRSITKRDENNKPVKTCKVRTHAHSYFVACERCYGAKIKCNKGRPCRGCTKAQVVRGVNKCH